jgi:hypothetical protein
MDSSIVWLILIALVALGLLWLLNRSEPSPIELRDSQPPRVDSYGIPGAASGRIDTGTPGDSGQSGGN